MTVLRSAATCRMRWRALSCDEGSAFAVAEEVLRADFGGQFDGLAGERRRCRLPWGGARKGPSPRCRVPFASCSATSSRTREVEALYVAFAGEVGDDVAFGVDDDEVGHARAVYACQVVSSGSSSTGWVMW